MTRPLIIALPGNEAMAERLARGVGAEIGQLETRQFPDGESYVRHADDVAGRHVVLVCTLDRPDTKFLRLAFAADAARQLGAAKVGLVAPYLSYMRQDRRFSPGEAISSATFASMVSSLVDWLVTVDPHLHRYGSLSEIYSVPARVVRAAPLLSVWIKMHVSAPLIIGPDVESEQWVLDVANAVGAPYKVLRKVRKGDRLVEIEIPDLGAFSAHTPVLVDDIASSAKTMIETAGHLAARGMHPPVCLAVHGLFSDAAFDELAAKASTVVTTNSVTHPSNAIDIAPAMSATVRDLVGAFAATVENRKEERA